MISDKKKKKNPVGFKVKRTGRRKQIWRRLRGGSHTRSHHTGKTCLRLRTRTRTFPDTTPACLERRLKKGNFYPVVCGGQSLLSTSGIRRQPDPGGGVDLIESPVTG